MEPCREVGGSLRRASRAVTRLHDQILRPSGLRATQFSILLALSALGSVPLGRLADGMVIDRTTLSRNIKPLISKGYIQTHGGRDRRSRLLGLSAAGEIKVRDTMGLWQNAQDHIIAGGGDRAGIGEPLSLWDD